MWVAHIAVSAGGLAAVGLAGLADAIDEGDAVGAEDDVGEITEEAAAGAGVGAAVAARGDLAAAALPGRGGSGSRGCRCLSSRRRGGGDRSSVGVGLSLGLHGVGDRLGLARSGDGSGDGRAAVPAVVRSSGGSSGHGEDAEDGGALHLDCCWCWWLIGFLKLCASWKGGC